MNKRTNITIKNEQLWAWAFGRAKQLNCRDISTYIFKLIQEDKEHST